MSTLLANVARRPAGTLVTLSCAVALFALSSPLSADEPGVTATPMVTPASTPPTGGDQPVRNADENDESRPMSREERLRQHRAKMLERLEEAREKRQKEHAEKFIEETMAAVQQEQAARDRIALDRANQALQRGEQLDGAMATAIAERQSSVRDALLDRLGLLIFPQPSTLVLDEGERKAVDYIVYNRNGVTAAEYSISLAYAPWAMKPVAIYADEFSRMTGNTPDVFLDEELGRLTIRAIADRPIEFDGAPIATVVWEALRPMREEEIRFVFGGEYGTAIRNGASDLLGLADIGDDGTLSGRARVRALDVRPEVRRYEDGGLVAGILHPERESGEMGVFLAPMFPTAHTGEEVFVAVFLNNPDRVAFNRVELLIEFDPEVLEVVDDDSNNAIRRGVNIADSADIAKFGFDHFLANEADNEAGRVRWHSASAAGSTVDGGLLASIRFRAKKPADLTRISFSAPAEIGELGTRVVRQGRDVLRRDRLEESALIRTLPEREGGDTFDEGGLILIAEERDVRDERRDRRARDRRRELLESDPLEVNGATAIMVGEAAMPSAADSTAPIVTPTPRPRRVQTLEEAREIMERENSQLDLLKPRDLPASPPHPGTTPTPAAP